MKALREPVFALILGYIIGRFGVALIIVAAMSIKFVVTSIFGS